VLDPIRKPEFQRVPFRLGVKNSGDLACEGGIAVIVGAFEGERP